MLNRMFPFVALTLVLLTTATGLIGIGNLLLLVHDRIGVMPAVWTALGLTLAVGAICSLLSVRASRLPPVQLPGPMSREPVRRIDLGAGYLVGQFVLIFGAMLLLLFVILAVR